METSSFMAGKAYSLPTVVVTRAFLAKVYRPPHLGIGARGLYMRKIHKCADIINKYIEIP